MHAGLRLIDRFLDNALDARGIHPPRAVGGYAQRGPYPVGARSTSWHRRC